MKPNKWSCLPMAFSMATGLDFNLIISSIGHDGSEIVEEGYAEPLGRRGFHPQEIIDVLLRYGHYIITIDYMPQQYRASGHIYEVLNKEEADKRFKRYMENNTGVLVGISPGGKGHAFAVIEGTVFDPDTGRKCEYYKSYTPDAFFIVR